MRNIICLLTVITGLLSGCARTIYKPVETVRTDSIYISTHKVDTVLTRDSIYVERLSDTIREVRYKWVYKVREHTDTLWRERHDTISVPYPVEKKLTRWQQTKQDIGGMAIGGIAIAVCLAVICGIKKIIR